MAGSGFLAGTTSPAKTAILAASSGATTCSTTARTDSSAEVEATATGQPAASASPITLATPGRAGRRPAATMSL